MTSQTLPLNLIPKGVCPRLYVSQYDKGQEWNFDIYAGTEAYTIPSGSTVTIQGTKPDKTGFQYACSFSGNRVTATEQQQMTIIAGDVPAEIRIEKNNEIIATLNFIIAVEKAALADDTVISETDLPLIEEAIEVLGHADELVQRIEGDVTTSGNNALKAEGFAVGQQNGSDVASGSPYYHNSAKYYKEQAADSASTASNKASDASGSASAASGSASSASTNALKAEGFAVGQQNGSDVASGSPYYHNSAKYYKEQAADSASTASTKAGEAAASAQAAAQSAAHLTIDGAMSTTSENALQNKVITTTIQNLSNKINVNGVKNVLPNNLVTKKESGMWILVDDDGVIKLYGTASVNFNTANTTIFNGVLGIEGTYILSDSASGETSNTKCMFYGINNGNTTRVDGSAEITLTKTDILWVGIYCAQGTVGDDLLLKPMLCLKSAYELDPTYEPHVETNKQLTVNKASEELLAEVGGINYVENTATGGGTAATWVINEDKTLTVTVNQALSSTSRRELSVSLKKGTYRFCGCPSGGSWGKWNLYPVGNNVLYFDRDTGDGGIMTLSADETITIRMDVSTGAPVGSVITFKPMVCPVSYNGSYVPYAKSNKQLTAFCTEKTYFNCTVRANRGTIVEQNNFRVGNTVYLYIKAIPNVGGHIPFLTIPSGFRPIKPSNSPYVSTILNVHNLDYTNRDYVDSIIDSDSGEVDLYSATANATYIISGVYYCEQ